MSSFGLRTRTRDVAKLVLLFAGSLCMVAIASALGSRSPISDMLDVYERPVLLHPTVLEEEGQIGLDFGTLYMEIATNSSNNATITLWHGGRVDEVQLTYPIYEGYFDQAFALDINGDGNEDVVVVSYPVGASGISASIVRMAVILLAEGEVQAVELSTFSNVLQPKDMFVDFSQTGRYDFIMFQRAFGCGDTWDYYTVDVFSFNLGTPINVSEMIQGLPRYVMKYRDTEEFIFNPPGCLDRDSRPIHPTVWLH